MTLRELVATAARWRASAVLATAVLDAWPALDLARPDPDGDLAGQLVDWASRHRPTLTERLLLDAHRRPGYVYWRQLAGVAVRPRLARPAAATWAPWSWPQPDYLADRRWSVASHLRRAGRTLTAPVRNAAVGAARRVRRRGG